MGSIEEVLIAISGAERKRKEIIADAVKMKEKMIKDARKKAQDALKKAISDERGRGEANYRKARSITKKEADKIREDSERMIEKYKKLAKRGERKARKAVLQLILADSCQ